MLESNRFCSRSWSRESVFNRKYDSASGPRPFCTSKPRSLNSDKTNQRCWHFNTHDIQTYDIFYLVKVQYSKYCANDKLYSKMQLISFVFAVKLQ